MKLLVRILLILVVVVLAGGIGWLAVTEPDPPQQDMEKVISNDRFDL